MPATRPRAAQPASDAARGGAAAHAGAADSAATAVDATAPVAATDSAASAVGRSAPVAATDSAASAIGTPAPVAATGSASSAAGAPAAGSQQRSGERAAGRAPHAVNVKVCGITNLADAELARELGAWAIGMVFHEDSPRSCSRAQARVICAALRRRSELCGVFVNAPLEEIVLASEELGLTLLQLHGEEGPSFCAEARRRTGARVIKAAQVSGEGDVRDLERFHVDFHLLDTRPRARDRRSLRGGTGESFDWSLAGARRSRVPLILSGGLSAENVSAAIAATHPWAVDTASGTEAAPGHKDARKLRAFFDAAHKLAAAPTHSGQPA